MRGDEPISNDGKYIGVGICPTCVGMNRAGEELRGINGNMPHMRGDEPKKTDTRQQAIEYAPHAWG